MTPDKRRLQLNSIKTVRSENMKAERRLIAMRQKAWRGWLDWQGVPFLLMESATKKTPRHSSLVSAWTGDEYGPLFEIVMTALGDDIPAFFSAKNAERRMFLALLSEAVDDLPPTKSWLRLWDEHEKLRLRDTDL